MIYYIFEIISNWCCGTRIRARHQIRDNTKEFTEEEMKHLRELIVQRIQDRAISYCC